MGNSLNLIGGTMFVIWIVEYFGYNGEASTHILLVSAIIVFMVKMFLYLPTRGKI